MAFTAAPTACKPSLLLSPRASSSSARARALLCRTPSTPSRFHGLRAPAPTPCRRAASSTGVVCGRVTEGGAPPNFALKDQGGKLVVPYFYPDDETPGGTKQSEGLPSGSVEELAGRTCALPTWALIGGVTAGVAVALALSAGAGPAVALGPEGPLVEEFWDNMRRYALYALTVSTGFAWALLQPIWELLRSPVTAVLIVVVIVGGGILMSQVINAMAGNSDFVYMYEQ